MTLITDPDYSRAFTKMRCVAWAHGYALMLHGTATRDLDVLAVPWVDAPADYERLLANIRSVLQGEWQDSGQAPSKKPHGRLVWTLIASALSDPRFIDFGVMAPRQE